MSDTRGKVRTTVIVGTLKTVDHEYAAIVPHDGRPLTLEDLAPDSTRLAQSYGRWTVTVAFEPLKLPRKETKP